MSKFSKTIKILDDISSDRNVAQVKVLCMGMKKSGKTFFREKTFEDYGDEKERHEKFADLEGKRLRSEAMHRTCLRLEERNYIDIGFKRVEPDEYEWEDKKVKVHFLEPGMDFKMERDVSSFLSHINCLVIFLDQTAVSVDDFDLNICLPFLRKIEDLPPIVLVYHAKGNNGRTADKCKVRNYIGYDTLVSVAPNQILEVEAKDLMEREDREAIINACLRQATLKEVLALPRPNPRVVANQ